MFKTIWMLGIYVPLAAVLAHEGCGCGSSDDGSFPSGDSPDDFFEKDILEKSFVDPVITFVEVDGVTNILSTEEKDLSSKTVKIISPENFYAVLAKEIGGKYVDCSYVMNASLDPHHFSPSPKQFVKILDADILIVNGFGYDDWACIKSYQDTINVSDMFSQDDKIKNNHFWFHPQTFINLAKTICKKLSTLMPEHEEYFSTNLNVFVQKMLHILVNNEGLESIKKRKIKVISNEPLFNYMLMFLNMEILNEQIQNVSKNCGDLSGKEIYEISKNFQDGKYELLVYNKQAHSSSSAFMISLAYEEKVPVLTITESMSITFTSVADWISYLIAELIDKLE